MHGALSSRLRGLSPPQDGLKAVLYATSGWSPQVRGLSPPQYGLKGVPYATHPALSLQLPGLSPPKNGLKPARPPKTGAFSSALG